MNETVKDPCRTNQYDFLLLSDHSSNRELRRETRFFLCVKIHDGGNVEEN